MDKWKNSGAGYGKQRHGLGKPVDGGAPLLPQEKEDRGNQSARVADSDPPDEVNDRKAPCNRNLNAPDPHAHSEEVRDGIKEQHHERERSGEAQNPPPRRTADQNNRADLIRHGSEVVSVADDRRGQAWLGEFVGGAMP